MSFQQIICIFSRFLYNFSMDKKEIENLRESSTVELKKCADKLPASIWETYSAFANSEGGDIYLGVEERKRAKNFISGISNPQSVLQAFTATVNNSLKVSRNVLNSQDIELAEIDDKTIMHIHVRGANLREKPVYLNNNPFLSYKRLGDSDCLMSLDEVLSLMNDSMPFSRDQEANRVGVVFADLSKITLKKYREDFAGQNPNDPLINADDETFFTRVGALIKTEHGTIPTNAGVLCFGKLEDILKIYPRYSLDFQVRDFGAVKWNSRIVTDDGSFAGNIFDFFNLVIAQLRALLPSPFYVENNADMGKTKVFLTVREAFINALFNADYSLPDAVRIIFDYRRIVIYNSGSMRIDLPLALAGGHSNPRNTLISSLFRRLRLGDKAGSGIPTMFANMKDLNMMTPSYTDDRSKLSTTVRINFLKAVDQPTQEIYDFLCLHDHGLSTKDLSDELGFTRYRISESLSKLQQTELVVDNGKVTKGKLFSAR